MENCQFCGKPATVHMTQIINNKTTVVHMCNECAAKHGLFDKEGLPFAMLSNLGESLFAGVKQQASLNGLICSECGCTPMAFRETGRLGCTNCYKDLRLLVDGIIESSQKGMTHNGKRPKNSQEKVSSNTHLSSKLLEKPIAETTTKKRKTLGEKLDDLQNKLAEAVKEEKYEEAAKLRDEIKRIKASKN